MFVYTTQPVDKPVVDTNRLSTTQPVVIPVVKKQALNRLFNRLYEFNPFDSRNPTSSLLFNRFDNRLNNRLHRVCIQPVVTPVEQRFWQPVECLFILIPRLHDTTVLTTGLSCKRGLSQKCWIHTTGWTTGCTAGWTFVYTIQLVVQPLWHPVG